MRINGKNSITLVYLNYSSFKYSQISIGLASIYTYLTQNKIKVHIIDTAPYNSLDDLIDQIEAFADLYIGISTTELHFNYAIEIARRLKNKNSKIILGGTYPTLFPEKCLSYPFVDLVCVGDGEHTLFNLIEGKNFKQIPGLWYKSENKIIENGISEIFDLNEFDITDYSGFSNESIYTIRHFFGNDISLIFTWSSRGCSFNCTYCCNKNLMQKSGQKLRFRDAVNFCNELLFLNKTYNATNFFLCDENFLANKNHVEKIIDAFPKESINKFNFGFLSRPEHIKRSNIKLLNKLVKIGWKWVSIGVEMGNEDKRSQYINRRHSNKQIYIAFRICHELGIKTNAFLISGFYFETVDDLILTDKLLRECLPSNVECSFFYPFQGTALFDYYESNRLFISNKESISYFKNLSISHPKFSSNDLFLINKFWNNWSLISDVNELIKKLEFKQ